MPDQGHGEGDDAARQAAGVHDLAGQHEERHGQQRKAVGAFGGVLRQDLRIEHVQVPHQRRAAQQQRERDRHPQRHGAEQRPEEDGDGHAGSPLPPRTSRHSSWAMTIAASTAKTTPLP